MLVEVNDLTRTYMMGSTEVNALRGVSFSVERGEFVAIMGPSGSGKSTLMHLLGCLDQPTSGNYLLDGTPVENLADQELSHLRNHKVGFVFQAFNLISQLTILENVEVPLIYMGMDRVRRQSLCLDMLKSVGLAHRAQHRPNELSGGENQRVAIARALVTNPDIILADEPTGNLDQKSAQNLMELLLDLNKNKKQTFIMATHNPKLAKLADRIYEIKEGKVFLIDNLNN